jgi:Lipase (class 3)
VPQWIVHVGGSVIPVIDPITKDSMLTSVWSGTLQTLPTLSDLLVPIIRGGGTIRVAGHSYGGGCAFALATWLKTTNNASTECMTFGEPKVFGGLEIIREPNVHFRVAAVIEEQPLAPNGAIDPVVYMPPGCLQYVGLGYLVKIANFIWTLKFIPRGQLVLLSDTSLRLANDLFVWSIPFLSDFLLQGQLIDGTLLHLMDSSYLPKVHAAWIRSGLYPELHSFDAYYTAYTGNPAVPPANWGPPISLNTINETLQLQDTPITAANQVFWTNVSSVGTIIPNPGGQTTEPVMSLFKGSLLCGIMNQGFSESLHSSNTADTYLTMKTKFGAVANARMQLSNGVNDAVQWPNNQMSIVAFRFSDELLFRDVLAVPTATPVGWSSSAYGNMDGQQAAKIVWRSATGQQIAVSYVHGVPVGASAAGAGNEARTSPWVSQYITAVQNYCNVIAANALGFNTINNTPANAFGPITNCVYNVVTGNWTITVTNAVPNGRFRVALRGFKSLRFLNGRQSANYVAANQFVVFKRVPNGVWDFSGTAVPLSGYNNFVPFSNYVVVVPATATPSLLCTKKLGRPFFLQAGRVTRRAA